MTDNIREQIDVETNANDIKHVTKILLKYTEWAAKYSPDLMTKDKAIDALKEVHSIVNKYLLGESDG